MNTPSSPRKPIRIGVAGLGRAGVNIHIKAILKDSRFNLTVVCDPLKERRDEIAASLGIPSFATLEQMVSSGLCELIVIATPSRFHFADAKAVLEGGCDCVLEKPMATTGAEARLLVGLAGRLNRRLFVHHNFLFDNEFLFLREVIASGVLGDIFHMEVFWTGFTRRWDWQTLRKNGGGEIFNTCPHLITLLLPLLGGDLEVKTSEARLVKNAGDVEDHVQMVLKGANGITVSAMASSVCALPFPRLTLFGSCGTLQEDYHQATLRFFDPTAVPVREVIDTAAPTDGSLQEELPWQEKQVPVQPKEPQGKFYDGVAATLLEGAPFAVDPGQAARVVEILEQISSSPLS